MGKQTDFIDKSGRQDMIRHSPEFQANIMANRRLNDQTAILTLAAPAIAASAQPGQFVNLSCDHFLRRPLGIMSRSQEDGTIDVGIRIQGEGTAWLAARQPGETVSVLGPLGQGYNFDGLHRVITVGGGTGVFPLYFVQQYCQEIGLEGIAVCGYHSRAESILADEYSGLSCRSIFASDCGDMAVAGHAGIALEQLLGDIEPCPGTAILTCGPSVMMRAVAEIAARHHLPCQVSLEERMACGIGVCLVCACAIKEQGSQEAIYKRCCMEGPVFPAEVVEWPT
jgi:dihydroorotate dehydrogenase electron transfer subunit